jgi:ribosomal protein S18 acetylase RimI-like enzyme
VNGVRRASFADVTMQEGAAALNRVFEEYLMPVKFSPEQLDLHLLYNDVDPAASPIWYDSRGEVVAAALLAVRDSRGWIGGFGVAPPQRGLGYGKALLAELTQTAGERGLQNVTLEVLSGNDAALALYRWGGFVPLRRLFSFQLVADASSAQPEAHYADPESYIDDPEQARPCWQRERASLRNGAVSSAVVGDGDYALFRSDAQIAQILKLRVAGANALRRVAQAAAPAPEANVLIINEPEESPVSTFARLDNWAERFVQYEMRLEL